MPSHGRASLPLPAGAGLGRAAHARPRGSISLAMADSDEPPPPYPYIDPAPSPGKKEAQSPGLVSISINLTQNVVNVGVPHGMQGAVPQPAKGEAGGRVFDSFPAPLSTSQLSVQLPALFNGDTAKFVGLCFLWYSTSALTNNIGKSILNHYSFPVTLTIVQFLLTGLFTAVFGHGLGFTRIRAPTREIIMTTAPLSLFQIVGHVMSSVAIMYVPVSFAHTIKALSPLFTVIIYRVVFGVPYSQRVYSSIFMVTVGVMLVCTNKVVFHHIGFFAALGSCLIFVVQNIFSKKLFSAARAAQTVGSHWHGGHSKTNPAKLDKLNLLFYSATTAFILMIPLWIYSDGVLSSPAPRLLPARGAAPEDDAPVKGWYFPGLYVSGLFLLNGASYFLQNILAFNLLSLVSPVTYSVASLVKRIFVIVAAMVWFQDSVTWMQAVGICTTFFGLWMYQGAKGDVARGEAKLEVEEAQAVAAEEGRPATPGKRTELWNSGHISPKPDFESETSGGTSPMLQSSTIRGGKANGVHGDD
ncbi:triose-phosphate transporter family-domain-containing protein [Hyaloraphidium curvatum]|nr:triose-phosphate transporter family-domain-containing protein [Hyaloraphidium curvatum]